MTTKGHQADARCRVGTEGVPEGMALVLVTGPTLPAPVLFKIPILFCTAHIDADTVPKTVGPAC